MTINCPALKNEVNLYNGGLTWSVECQRTDGTWATLYPPAADNRYSVSDLKMYALYSTPSAPMEIPWVEVLDHSCTWGAEQGAESTVAEALNNGLHRSGNHYDPEENHYSHPTNISLFKLTNFLNASKPTYMDCRDVSHFLSILSNSQGLGFTVSTLYSNPTTTNPTGSFTTIDLCPMGMNYFDNGHYWPETFDFHQVSRSAGGGVYDASNAHMYALNNVEFRKPPSNWSLSAYWNRLVALPNPSTPTPYQGLPEFYPTTVQ